VTYALKGEERICKEKRNIKNLRQEFPKAKASGLKPQITENLKQATTNHIWVLFLFMINL
jgi:hypothetical protein